MVISRVSTDSKRSLYKEEGVEVENVHFLVSEHDLFVL